MIPHRPGFFAFASKGSAAGPQQLLEQLVDPGFADNTKWTLAGSGIGTSAVSGGVLQITSVTNVYTAVGAYAFNTPLKPGTYTVVYTILNYVAGSISASASTAADLSSSTDGTTNSANGTYTQDLGLPSGGYIGLKGEGAAIVNNLQIDNMSIKKSS